MELKCINIASGEFFSLGVKLTPAFILVCKTTYISLDVLTCTFYCVNKHNHSGRMMMIEFVLFTIGTYGGLIEKERLISIHLFFSTRTRI